MDHPKDVKGLSPQELAQEFGRTEYGYHLEFFIALENVYREQSSGDYARGRKKLGTALQYLGNAFRFDLIPKVRDVWDICKPYMTRAQTQEQKPKE